MEEITMETDVQMELFNREVLKEMILDWLNFSKRRAT